MIVRINKTDEKNKIKINRGIWFVRYLCMCLFVRNTNSCKHRVFFAGLTRRAHATGVTGEKILSLLPEHTAINPGRYLRRIYDRGIREYTSRMHVDSQFCNIVIDTLASAIYCFNIITMIVIDIIVACWKWLKRTRGSSITRPFVAYNNNNNGDGDDGDDDDNVTPKTILQPTNTITVITSRIEWNKIQTAGAEELETRNSTGRNADVQSPSNNRRLIICLSMLHLS